MGKLTGPIRFLQAMYRNVFQSGGYYQKGGVSSSGNGFYCLTKISILARRLISHTFCLVAVSSLLFCALPVPKAYLKPGCCPCK